MRNSTQILTQSLNAGGTATYTSPAIDIENCYGYSVHAKWTKSGGTLGGTFKTQKSNDGINWVEVSSDAIINASGSKELEVPSVYYKYYRIVANLTGGAADLYVATCAKGGA